MNLVTSIIRGEVAPERLGARNEDKDTFWQRTVKRKKCHQSPAVTVDDRNENKSYFTRSKLKE